MAAVSRARAVAKCKFYDRTQVKGFVRVSFRTAGCVDVGIVLALGLEVISTVRRTILMLSLVPCHLIATLMID